jgi:adenylate kinase
MSFNPPKRAGFDDETGEPLEQRPDDNAVRASGFNVH